MPPGLSRGRRRGRRAATPVSPGYSSRASAPACRACRPACRALVRYGGAAASGTGSRWVASANRRSASRASSTTSRLGPLSPMYASTRPPAETRTPALGTQCGRSRGCAVNGPTRSSSPAANSCRDRASASMPGRSSASTAVSAPGSAYTGQRTRRAATHRPGAEQRVEVGAVVGMAMADEHRVDVVRRAVLQQPGHRCVAEVDDQPEPVVLDQVAAARPAGLGPGALAQNRQPHPPDSRARGPRHWSAMARTCSHSLHGGRRGGLGRPCVRRGA